jgi:hypothetical protein
VIPSRSSGAVEYDFCIENITGITDNTSVGDPGTCGGDGGTGGTGGTGGIAGTSGIAGTGGTGTVPGSCMGRCDEHGASGLGCYCDAVCDDAGDCCDDKTEFCG